LNTGNYYKTKTKKWFKEKGYLCEYLERLQRITRENNKGIKQTIYIKRDIWGADGMAMNEEEIIFWNSKKGKAHLSSGKKEFTKYPYPPYIKRWLIVWEPRVKEPKIIEIGGE
jgi:hypothetical protein